MSGMSAAERFRHGVGPEPRSGMDPIVIAPVYQPAPAPIWSCPDCGTSMTDDEGGMWCHRCRRRWTWAELRNYETGD